jgi:hypothetical protein
LPDWLASAKIPIPLEYKTSTMIGDIVKNSFCCCCKFFDCCKKSKKGNRFDIASDRLNDELDIVKIIKKLRNHDFLIESFFKDYHFSLVPYFKDYYIDDETKNEEKHYFEKLNNI